MQQAASYEEDVHAWSQHQALLLRNLAGRGLALPNDLDLDRIAEEIEEVGNEQRHAAESHLLQALIHLIKVVALPEDPAVRHWLKETDAFLYNAGRRYRPSMARLIDAAALWRDARRLAARALEIDGHAVPDLPADPPLPLQALLAEDADPRALAAALADRLNRPG